MQHRWVKNQHFRSSRETVPDDSRFNSALSQRGVSRRSSPSIAPCRPAPHLEAGSTHHHAAIQDEGKQHSEHFKWCSIWQNMWSGRGVLFPNKSPQTMVLSSPRGTEHISILKVLRDLSIRMIKNNSCWAFKNIHYLYNETDQRTLLYTVYWNRRNHL